jgi:hypothetical protein
MLRFELTILSLLTPAERFGPDGCLVALNVESIRGD